MKFLQTNDIPLDELPKINIIMDLEKFVVTADTLRIILNTSHEPQD